MTGTSTGCRYLQQLLLEIRMHSKSPRDLRLIDSGNTVFNTHQDAIILGVNINALYNDFCEIDIKCYRLPAPGGVVPGTRRRTSSDRCAKL